MLWKDDGILDTWPKNTLPPNYNPNQQQIDFFWPLTEQIELDLDYTRTYDYDYEKNKLRLTTAQNTGQVLTITNGSTNIGWANVDTKSIPGIETPGITLTFNQKPSIIKRFMYQLLGIKWKIT